MPDEMTVRIREQLCSLLVMPVVNGKQVPFTDFLSRGIMRAENPVSGSS